MRDTPPKLTTPSRRGLIAAAGLGMGLSAGAAAARAGERSGADATASGLDLSDPVATARAAAKAVADLDGRPTWGWFEAEVLACGVTGTLTPVAIYRGVTLDRLIPVGSAKGWRRVHAEYGLFRDVVGETGEFSLRNPLTGRQVAAEPFERRASSTIAPDKDAGRRWRLSAQHAVLTEHETLPSCGGAQHGSRVVALADLVEPGTEAAASVGVWTRTLVWPNWFGLDDSPVHCVLHGRLAGGLASSADLPTEVRPLADLIRA